MTANASGRALSTLADYDEQSLDAWVSEAVGALYVYYTPLLVAVGSVGNLLSVFVFLTSKLHQQSTSQYLSALAVSDTIFLLLLLPPWLSVTHITGVFHSYGFCQSFIYFSYVSCGASAWFVVAFTLERFVAVLYPLRRNSMYTVSRARILVMVIVLASLVLDSPVLLFAAPRDGDCNIAREYLIHAARFNIMDTVLTFTLPLGLIVMLNVWIMAGVCRVERARRQLVKAGREAAGLLAVCPRSQQRVTRMLLLVSSVFVLCNLPAYTIRVLAYAYDMNSDEVGGRWTALQQISVMFFHTNFGINFFLYCLSGQNFRHALKQATPWFRNRARRSAAVRRPTPLPARSSIISSNYISSCADVTNNCTTSSNTPDTRRLPDHFIKRWTFDNSRQRSRSAPGNVVISENVEEVEMQTFGI